MEEDLKGERLYSFNHYFLANKNQVCGYKKTLPTAEREFLFLDEW